MVGAAAQGKAKLESAPAVAESIPGDAPPIMPFLFITIACGAISGFHCLVSSGTSSKQVDNEKDAQYVAYGSMLLEGGLAVIVILACTAGVGMGLFTSEPDGAYTQAMNEQGTAITGQEAWRAKYDPAGDWSKFTLANKLATARCRRWRLFVLAPLF